MKEDGSVVTWGDPDTGGDSSSVAGDLQSGVTQLFATSFAVAALKEDGSVVTWGHHGHGGDSIAVAGYLQSGVVSFADPFQDDSLAFEASSSGPSPALDLTVDTIAPVLTKADSASAIDENSGAGQVIYTASTTDISSVVYSLKLNNNDDSSSFSIEGKTGQVVLNEDPVFEKKSSYLFTVIATDAAGNSAEQSITSFNDTAEFPVIQSIHDVKAKRKAKTFKIQEPIILFGEGVDSVIVGTKKKDKISGTIGGEVLAGMKGKDVLKGGLGADGFFFNQSKGFGSKYADKIKDFDSEEGDLILLDKDVFSLGEVIAIEVVSQKKKVKKASKKDVDFVYDEKKGLLYFNEDGIQKGWGDGGLFAKLQGGPELGADDFTIV